MNAATGFIASQAEMKLSEQFHILKNAYTTEPYLPLNSRLELLRNIKLELLAKQDVLSEALSSDYGFRSEFDSVICD